MAATLREINERGGLEKLDRLRRAACELNEAIEDLSRIGVDVRVHTMAVGILGTDGNYERVIPTAELRP